MPLRPALLLFSLLTSLVLGETPLLELPENLPGRGVNNVAIVCPSAEELKTPWWLTDAYGQPLDKAKWDAGALQNYERTIGLHRYITSRLLPASVKHWTETYDKLRAAGKRVPRDPIAFDENKYLDIILEAKGENEFETRRSLSAQREQFQKATYAPTQALLCFTEANLSAYDFERKGYLIDARPVQFAPYRPDLTKATATGIFLRPGNLMGAAIPSIIVKQKDDYYQYGFFLDATEAEAEQWNKDHGKLLRCCVVSIVAPTGFTFNSTPTVSYITVEIKAAGLYVQTPTGLVLLKKITAYKSAPGELTPQQSFAVARALEADKQFLTLPE